MHSAETALYKLRDNKSYKNCGMVIAEYMCLD